MILGAIFDLDGTLLNTVPALQKSMNLTLKEFGSFSQVERAERQGHNPATGAKMTIPASKGVKWKASESFKKAL